MLDPNFDRGLHATNMPAEEWDDAFERNDLLAARKSACDILSRTRAKHRSRERSARVQAKGH